MRIIRLLLSIALSAGLASAQLLGGTNLSVVKVGKTEVSQGKVDSLTRILAASQLQGRTPTPEIMQQVRWAVVFNLVGEELLRLEAEKQKLQASNTKVDSLMKLFKQQFPSEAEFTKELKKTGTTMEQFKKKLRRQIESEMLLEKAVPYPKDPTQAEMKAYFDKHKSELSINDTIGGVKMLLKTTKSDNAQTIADKKQILAGLAAQWRSKRTPSLIQNVQIFQMMAAQYSEEEGAKKDGGLMPPFVAKSQGAEFANAVKGLKVGEVSEAFQTKEGVVIFLLTKKNDGKYESFEHEVDYLLRLTAEQDRQEKIKAYLKSLEKSYPVVYFNKDYMPPQGGK